MDSFEEQEMYIKKAMEDDFDFYYLIKCEKSFVDIGGFITPPNREKFLDHYTQLIQGNETILFMVWDEDMPVGYLQLTRNSELEIEIGYGVSEKYRGKGYGTFAVSAALEICHNMDPCINVIGYIREDNISSQKCFEKNGFCRQKKFKVHNFPLAGGDMKMYLYEIER